MSRPDRDDALHDGKVARTYRFGLVEAGGLPLRLGTSRETQILGHTQSLLPDNIRHPFDLDAELTRQRFFREDAEFNAAIAEWDLKLSELVNEEW